MNDTWTNFATEVPTPKGTGNPRQRATCQMKKRTCKFQLGSTGSKKNRHFFCDHVSSFSLLSFAFLIFFAVQSGFFHSSL